jgi:hypothetical protein
LPPLAVAGLDAFEAGTEAANGVRMPLSWPRLSNALLVSVALLPACDGDDGPDVPDIEPVAEATLRASFDTWRGGLRKHCSIDGVFDGRASSGLDRAVLDAELVLKALGGRLLIEEGSEAVVLGTPEIPSHTGAGSRQATVITASGERRTMTMATTLDDAGVCTVQIDGAEVFRGQLWGALPMVAQVKGPTALAQVEVEGGTDRYTPSLSFGRAYLEIDALDAVTEALAIDAPSATAMVARALGLSPADAAAHATVPPPWFPHVEADAATAPFPMFGGTGFGLPPLSFYTSPMVPVNVERLADWMPGEAPVQRTLQVRLPRPTLALTGSDERAERPVEIAVRVSLARGDSEGRIVGRVLSVSSPRHVPGGDGVAGACFNRVAEITLDYLHIPQSRSGLPRVPATVAVHLGGAAQQRWITGPCAVWTGDLPSAIRSSAYSIDLVARLINTFEYPLPSASRGVVANGWEDLLADLIPDGAALDALAANSTRVMLSAGVPALRALFEASSYGAAATADRRALRRLVWKAQLGCGDRALEGSFVRSLAATAAADVESAIAELRGCPIAP